MDWLRTGYKTKMRLIVGGPPVEVIWYRCLPDAQDYPGVSRYCSRDWSERKEEHDVGELPGPRIWYDGHDPGGFALGQNSCGAPSVFANGAVATDPTFACDPTTGVGPCCEASDPIISSGGLVWNGTASTFRPQGGLVWDGVAVAGGTKRFTGSGGLVWNGAAFTSGRNVYVGSGGLVWNGSAGTTKNWDSTGHSLSANQSGTYYGPGVHFYESTGKALGADQSGDVVPPSVHLWDSSGRGLLADQSGDVVNAEVHHFESTGKALSADQTADVTVITTYFWDSTGKAISANQSGDVRVPLRRWDSTGEGIVADGSADVVGP